MFSERLKETRILRELSQSELGELVNLTQSTLYCYENGKREPKVSDIVKLCLVLGVDANYLLGLDKFAPRYIVCVGDLFVYDVDSDGNCKLGGDINQSKAFKNFSDAHNVKVRVNGVVRLQERIQGLWDK